MKVNHRVYNLPFRYPFTISKGTKTHQPTFIVELEFNGIKGYGEAPAITYYNIPVEKMETDLEAKKTFVEKYAFTEPGTLLALFTSPVSTKSFFSLCFGYCSMGYFCKT
jgi:L-alanine-DL-glutamate epimerase-like enolase superfamily enzyme